MRARGADEPLGGSDREAADAPGDPRHDVRALRASSAHGPARALSSASFAIKEGRVVTPGLFKPSFGRPTRESMPLLDRVVVVAEPGPKWNKGAENGADAAKAVASPKANGGGGAALAKEPALDAKKRKASESDDGEAPQTHLENGVGADSCAADVSGDTEVFMIRFTGELFLTYEAYMGALRSYRTRKWACRYTGTKNLTYEEAVDSEQRALAMIKPLPTPFHGLTARTVHHALLSTDSLTTLVQRTLGRTFVDGEVVRLVGGADGNSGARAAAAQQRFVVVRGEAAEPATNGGAAPAPAPAGEASAPASDAPAPSRFLVRAVGSDGSPLHDSPAIWVPKDRVKRPKYTLDKLMLRKWIFDHCECRPVFQGTSKKHCWFVNPTLVATFGLAPSLPEASGLTTEPVIRPKEPRVRKRPKPSAEGQDAGGANTNAALGGPPVFKPGSMKYVAYELLKKAGAEGLTCQQIIKISGRLGLRDWSSNAKPYNALFGALSHDAAFVKTDRGRFTAVGCGGSSTLALSPSDDEADPRNKENRAPGGQPTAQANGVHGQGQEWGGCMDAATARIVKVARDAVSKYEERAERAEAALAEEEATAAAAHAAAKAAAAAPLPERLVWDPALEVFTGDSFDRKQVVAHRKFVTQEKERREQEVR